MLIMWDDDEDVDQSNLELDLLWPLEFYLDSIWLSSITACYGSRKIEGPLTLGPFEVK